MVYNAFGQKKRETNPDSDTLFTWDGDDYYGFADAANNPENAVKIFIGDGGTMLGEFDPSDSQSRMDYMVDFLGSVTGQTNKKGDLGSERRFKPFGELLSGDPVKPLDFAWTGNTGSMHTGLLYSEQYNRARHYSTTTNIWTTRDLLWPSEHPYGYVGVNPVLRIDPAGTGYTFGDGCKKSSPECPSNMAWPIGWRTSSCQYLISYAIQDVKPAIPCACAAPQFEGSLKIKYKKMCVERKKEQPCWVRDDEANCKSRFFGEIYSCPQGCDGPCKLSYRRVKASGKLPAGPFWIDAIDVRVSEIDAVFWLDGKFKVSTCSKVKACIGTEYAI